MSHNTPIISSLKHHGIFILILALLASNVFAKRKYNDFDVSNITINKRKVISGGPPRDGIPSINNPKFIAISEVNYLRDDDVIISMTHAGQTRAYPTRILVWHEIVNDFMGDKAIAVTYCPLCGTAMVFDRNAGGALRTFGVSGLLYQSDVLMYDRETESLWSQLGMKAVSGPAVDSELDWLVSEHLTWSAWREKYPQGKVLSTDTGFAYNYQAEAYASYFKSKKTMFPVPRKRRELPNKSWVVGIIIDGQARAYSIKDLTEHPDFKDRLGDKQISVHYDPETKHPRITGYDGETIPSVMVFWFAWQAFYPKTELWKP